MVRRISIKKPKQNKNVFKTEELSFDYDEKIVKMFLLISLTISCFFPESIRPVRMYYNTEGYHSKF